MMALDDVVHVSTTGERVEEVVIASQLLYSYYFGLAPHSSMDRSMRRSTLQTVRTGSILHQIPFHLLS